MASLRSNDPSQVIAVSGGTGSVGAHIIEELLRIGKFEVVLLLRKENPAFLGSLKAQFPASSEKLHFSVVTYSSPSPLVDAFTKHSVDTVISVLFDPDAEKMRQSQRNLLVAAEQVSSVRRFSPTDWAVGLETDNNKLISRANEAKYDIIPLLRNSPLNWMGFSTGLFMNYFASGAPSRVVGGETRPPTGHLLPLKLIADIENSKAMIPILEDRKEPSVVFTRIEDVGKFVAHACLLDNVGWKEGQGKMIGWRGTYTDVCKIAESVLGKPLNISYVTTSELEKGIDPSAPPMATFFVEAQVGIAKGICDWKEDVLGAALRSQGLGFTPRGVEESMKEWWGL